MSDVNQVLIEGRLGRDPQITNTENGKIARFSIASAEHYKVADEIKERVTWNQVAVYDKFKAEEVEKKLHKGSHVIVSGAMETHSFDKDGETRYATEVALRPGKAMLRIFDIASRDAASSDDAPDLKTVAGQRQQQQQVRSHEQ